jgi:hypothetical protein
MSDARCSCGAITVSFPEEPQVVVACHCIECQRRTGSPFGVGTYFPAERVKISGTAKEFVRDGSSGRKLSFCFCPNCGSTVYWRMGMQPEVIGIAIGAIADPKYPAPAR